MSRNHLPGGAARVFEGPGRGLRRRRLAARPGHDAGRPRGPWRASCADGNPMPADSMTAGKTSGVRVSAPLRRACPPFPLYTRGGQARRCMDPCLITAGRRPPAAHLPCPAARLPSAGGTFPSKIRLALAFSVIGNVCPWESWPMSFVTCVGIFRRCGSVGNTPLPALE